MELFCIHRVYLQMKTIFLIPALFLFVTSVNADNQILTAVSPEHRVSLLELYTSEGCSSCPPADKFLSNLQRAGVSSKQLIPLAFHVTYWDYIGWKDPYASPKHDGRQRKQHNLIKREPSTHHSSYSMVQIIVITIISVRMFVRLFNK